VQQDIYDGPELSGNRQEKAGLPQLQKQGSKKTNYVISHKDFEKKLSTPWKTGFSPVSVDTDCANSQLVISCPHKIPVSPFLSPS
jgi:hypothetical protein